MWIAAHAAFATELMHSAKIISGATDPISQNPSTNNNLDQIQEEREEAQNKEAEMVYTEERLQRAIEVFRQSEPYRRQNKLSGGYLGSFLERKSKQYETRSGRTAPKCRPAATGRWIDEDESGEYVPGRKKVLTKTQKQTTAGSKRKRCSESAHDESRAGKKQKASYISGRQKGLSLEVTFHFNSAAARATVAELFPADVPDLVSEGNGQVLEISDGDGNDHAGQFSGHRHDQPSLSEQSPSLFFQEECDLSYEGDGAKSYGSPMAGVIESYPIQQSPQTGAVFDPIIIDESHESIPAFGEGSGRYGQTIKTKFIRTNWAHPIEYRCEPSRCNFCQDFRYPIFGCGAVDIEVIEIEPGLYEEMGGGHRERGVAPTRICLNCSLERIAISKCSGHEILHVEGSLEEKFDYPSFLNSITKFPRSEYLTCSVCISPAFYACATRQTVDLCSFPLSGTDGDGCGLLLCRDCAGIVARWGVDMERMERESGGSKRLRADKDFLLPSSDLWRALRR